MFMAYNLARSARVVFRKPLLLKFGFKRSFKTDQSLLQRKGFVKRLTTTISKLEYGSSRTGRFAAGIGQCLVSGMAVLAAGGFAHYILGVGHIRRLDLTVLPHYARNRIFITYIYFGISVMLSACSSVFCMWLLKRNSRVLRFVANNSTGLILPVFLSQYFIGSTLVGISLKTEFEWKHFLYVFQSVFVGVTVAPIILVSGLSVRRAAFVSTGILGGLALIGSNTTVRTYRGYERQWLAATLLVPGAFFSYMIGGRITPFANILYWTFMHGGLALYSIMFLYDSNNIVHHSDFYPEYYDPINESMRIYMDAVNIFVRMIFLTP